MKGRLVAIDKAAFRLLRCNREKSLHFIALAATLMVVMGGVRQT